MQEAVAYHERHKPQALLISCNGQIVHESFDDGFAARKPHALYSGTKSFWGPAAVVAEREGLLRLDETVGETIAEWRNDPVKRQVTLHQLLTLTAGIGFGGLGSAVPPYEKALAVTLRDRPGTKFTYGGIPLQVFGAVFARKLQSSGMTPHDYLRKNILRAAGIEIASWRELPDGTSPLPTGAFLTAGNWLRYGLFILDRVDEFSCCFQGTAANPRYGLTWWLAPPGTPADTIYASGSGGQALYVIPSLRLAAARFGNSSSYKHDAFLKRLSGALKAPSNG